MHLPTATACPAWLCPAALPTSPDPHKRAMAQPQPWRAALARTRGAQVALGVLAEHAVAAIRLHAAEGGHRLGGEEQRSAGTQAAAAGPEQRGSNPVILKEARV